jgi:hypothetical protein
MSGPLDEIQLLIVHGAIETADEASSLEAIRAAVEPGWRKTVGTNDQTVYVVTPAVLTHQLAEALAAVPSWWRMTIGFHVLSIEVHHELSIEVRR